MPQRPLYLIGFMASGKTTLGKALCARFPACRFIDLDQAVETREGMSVSEIFDRRGADYFRAAESDVLRSVTSENAIVACGGGTPCHSDNMDYMLAHGTVVWLQAPTEVTIRRLALAPGQRPLVDALLDNRPALEAYIDRLMSERRPHYSRAHLIFDSGQLEDEEQIESSCAAFSAMLHQAGLSLPTNE